jgi:hypothetical protein
LQKILIFGPNCRVITPLKIPPETGPRDAHAEVPLSAPG